MIHHGIDYSVYAGMPGWRWSHIKLLLDGSLAHARHAQSTSGDTASRRVLRAIHTAVLEPHRFDVEFSIYDGTRRGKAYEAHCAEHPGTHILNPRERDEIRAVADAIKSHPVARDLLAQGEAEVSMDWTDEATGLQLLARLDWLSWAGGIVDLKGVGTAEYVVRRQVVRMMWHGQLAHYDAACRAHGIEPPGHWLITYEVKPPFDVAVWHMGDAPPDGPVYRGAVLRERLLARLVEELRREEEGGSWRGRYAQAQSFVLPDYALEDDELTFGDAEEGEEEIPWT